MPTTKSKIGNHLIWTDWSDPSSNVYICSDEKNCRPLALQRQQLTGKEDDDVKIINEVLYGEEEYED